MIQIAYRRSAVSQYVRVRVVFSFFVGLHNSHFSVSGCILMIIVLRVTFCLRIYIKNVDFPIIFNLENGNAYAIHTVRYGCCCTAAVLYVRDEPQCQLSTISIESLIVLIDVMGPTLLVYAGIFTTTVLLRAPVSGAFVHQQATARYLAREVLPLSASHVDDTRSKLNLVIPRDRSSR